MPKGLVLSLWGFNSALWPTCLQSYGRIHSRQVSSLTTNEFKSYFEECVPQSTSNHKLAVAFSGGPDSTCLLYLLKEIMRSNPNSRHIPKSVVAITIDHDLQSCSSKMTEQCAHLAALLDVKHLILKIPWGKDLFPPPPTGKFESLARESRYHLLFKAMLQEDIHTIAFGHHLDDQVETALLRLANGSGIIGAAGMRPSRLWGMGFGYGPNDIGWAGRYGMNRWVIRPLLKVPKERILATCRENKLDYVVDPSNSQPGVALRNHIRHVLKTGSTETLEGLASGSKTLFAMAAKVSADFPTQKHSFNSGPDLVPQLRIAVQRLSTYVENNDLKVSTELKRCLRPSPTSTLLLASGPFSRIVDNSIRLDVVRRILRYVSPFPWGSRNAEAGRRSAALQRIADEVFFSSVNSNRRNFAAGGGVLWIPVSFDKAGNIKYSDTKGDYERGWLISRQPPIRRYKDQNSDALEVDITQEILLALESHRPEAGDSVVDVLYDCRFSVQIRPMLLPHFVLDQLIKERKQESDSIKGIPITPRTRILLIPHTRYFLPKVVLRTKDKVIHGNLNKFDSEERYQLPSLIETQRQCTRRAGESKTGESDPETELEIARLSPEGKVVTTMAFDVLGEDNRRVAPSEAPGDSSPVRMDWIRIFDTTATLEPYSGGPSE